MNDVSSESILLVQIANLIKDTIYESKLSGSYTNYSDTYNDIAQKVKCTVSQFQRAAHTHLPELSKIDLLKPDIRQAIEILYKNTPDNIGLIGRKMKCKRSFIANYIEHWHSNGDRLTPTALQLFNTHYQSYLDSELDDLSTFSELVFSNPKCGQMILLHMQQNMLISRGHYQDIRRGAIKREIYFNISGEYINKIYNIQGGKSKMSELALTSYYRHRDSTSPYVYSVDRIDNNIGYVEGNIQLVSKTENMMKGVLKEAEFEKKIMDMASVIYKKRYGVDSIYTALVEKCNPVLREGLDIELYDIDNDRFRYN
jgi:hypothetical protein